jgi:ribosomal protein S27AE
MSDLRRRVSYLAGLAERYDIREAGREGRVLSEVIQVLREVALDVDEVAQSQREMEAYVEELDSDLLCLEETVFDDAEALDEAGEGPEGVVADGPRLSDQDEDEAYIELECPRCDQPSYFAEHLFNEEGIELTCPHCGYTVFDESADRLVTEEDGSASEMRPQADA